MHMSSLSNLSSPDVRTKSAIPKMPRLPEGVVQRFPEMKEWQDEMDKWVKKLEANLKGTAY
jgi:hypothetical protein